MRNRRAKPLRHQLFLLAALGLLPVSLLGGWGIWSAMQSQRHELERSTLELSRALATAVESEIDATMRSLAAMGNSRMLANGDVRSFYDVAQNEVAARPAWAAVVLTDGQGRLVFKTTLPFGAQDARVVDPASLQETIASRRPVVGRVSYGQLNVPAFPVRWPVFNGTNVSHVLTAAVKPDRILEVLNKQRVPTGWVIAVFDSSDTRVARTRENLNTGPSESLARLLALGRDYGTGITQSLEGDELYTGFTRLKEIGWTVAVGAPTVDTWASLARSLMWYVAGALTSVLVCLALARRIASRIAGDIESVRDKAVRLGEGNLGEGKDAGRSAQAMRSRIEEVDQMALALRSASERLNESNASMRQALSQAHAAAQAKDQFLAVLGHELRNPLAPMLTALHLLDQKADASTAHERQIMNRQMGHMRRLVDDLLDISRITRGKLEMRSEPVNLFNVIAHALEVVQPAVDKRGRDITLVRPEQPVWVRGDETRLVQAVTNLLTNALRFGGDGEVALLLMADAPARIALVEVRDKGEGLTPEAIQHVFDPFYQAPQTLERSNGGLGLGLAIVRSVIQLHGGQVSAQSHGPGQGSSFSIVLPTIDAPADAADAKRSAGTGSEAKARVLVVDDNIDALEMLAILLAEAGHDVKTATHPREALKVIDEFSPEVAIFDIGLPEMDGYELARQARDAAPDWHGALVAVTGYGQQSDKARAAEAGFALHLTKPVEPAALLDAVEMLLKQG